MSIIQKILPPPFEWVKIPEGKTTLIEQHRGLVAEDTIFDVASFDIAKYPITNLQFTKFVEADGYNERRFWTDESWQIRKSENWDNPTNWQTIRWCDDCPVGGISWYEAMAFCSWLSEEFGEAITIPTEAQWQLAAQGDDGRMYPWGDSSDSQFFNSYDSHFRKPTPVQKYEAVGYSAFGVIDMAGNVWEWCLNKWDSVNGKERRALRGGSFSNYRRFAQTQWRNDAFPYDRFEDMGMRIASAKD